MGEVRARGTGAESFLNQTLTNDLHKLPVGHGQYTLMCNERGGVIDDLYAYHLGPEEYMLIINASRIEADVSWLKKQLAGFPDRDQVVLEDVSDATGAVAVQGPRVVDFINQVFSGASLAGTVVSRPTELKKNQVAQFRFGSGEVWVSRTGYTGEDGFEIITPAALIEKLWNQLLAVGTPFGLKPAGLGARDTLRTEACYPLYGHELDENTTPIEAGVGFFVALDKGEFVGRKVLAEQKEKGVTRKLVAFKMTGRSAPPRPQYPVWSTGPGATAVGCVVSGTQSPTLNLGIGLGYVPPQFAKAQTALEVEIRGKRAGAVVVPKPFYRKAD
jgi:aminomethyltransferase